MNLAMVRGKKSRPDGGEGSKKGLVTVLKGVNRIGLDWNAENNGMVCAVCSVQCRGGGVTCRRRMEGRAAGASLSVACRGTSGVW